MHTALQLEHVDAAALRTFAAQLMAENDACRRDNTLKQLRIDQLTHREVRDEPASTV